MTNCTNKKKDIAKSETKPIDRNSDQQLLSFVSTLRGSAQALDFELFCAISDWIVESALGTPVSSKQFPCAPSRPQLPLVRLLEFASGTAVGIYLQIYLLYSLFASCTLLIVFQRLVFLPAIN